MQPPLITAVIRLLGMILVVSGMRGKGTLSPHRERLRKSLQDIVDRDFGGNGKLAAQALGVSQPLVSYVLRGEKNVGFALLEALANYTGRSLDDLAGRPPLRFRDLPGWGPSLPIARRLFPHLPPEAFEAVGGFSAEHPPADATPSMIGFLASGWLEGATPKAYPSASQAAAAEDFAPKESPPGDPQEGGANTHASSRAAGTR